MRFLMLLTFLFQGIDTYCQRQNVIDNIKQHAQFLENTIYLFCRGTRTKSYLIAHNFNKADTNITHVGIGFLENGKLLLYNDTDNNRGSALQIDSLASFISSSDVYYLEVWKMRTRPKDFNSITKACED